MSEPFYTLCRMTESHLSQVAALEKACFPLPWSEESLRLLLPPAIGRGVVALVADRVVAYGGILPVAGEGQITNILTDPAYRSRGIGRAVIAALLECARLAQCENVLLEVRKSNLRAQSLYRSLGFTEIGTRHAFYRMPTEDAVMMEIKVKK